MRKFETLTSQIEEQLKSCVDGTKTAQARQPLFRREQLRSSSRDQKEIITWKSDDKPAICLDVYHVVGKGGKKEVKEAKGFRFSALMGGKSPTVGEIKGLPKENFKLEGIDSVQVCYGANGFVCRIAFLSVSASDKQKQTIFAISLCAGKPASRKEYKLSKGLFGFRAVQL